MSTSVIEKLASVPPALVFITSFTGWINWQSSFYAISSFWVALQIYFRIRKEYGKWKIRREIQGRGVP